MLLEYRVQNYLSFNSEQKLNMVGSTSTREDHDDRNVISVNKFGVEYLLKSAALFGANASGKSNFVLSLRAFKGIVTESLKELKPDSLGGAVPFFLKNDFYDEPTEFEVSFVVENKAYRYGIAIENETILEEWLYWIPKSRETLLFHRDGQQVEFNNKSFSEAKDFVVKKGDKFLVDKTKEFVPFVSVLAQFDGEKSSAVIDWFSKLQIISGITNHEIKDFTIDLLENNNNFKTWVLEILGSLQIQDIIITEVDKELPERPSGLADELHDAAQKVESFLRKNNIKEKVLEVVKVNKETGEQFTLPMSFESEGTRKLLYLLGPLYDILENNLILVVDEFDNKFHSLLSKYLIELYHKHNNCESQLIMTSHDTNLLDKKLFRRDQMWFVEKNNKHESELYSLVEYKEHYVRKSDSYGKDYLAGKYGAIPLFSSIDKLKEMMNG